MSELDEKAQLLAELARLMPEEWLSPYERNGESPIRLDILGSDTLYPKTICYVRLESDLIEAPALVAILEWLRAKKYRVEMGFSDSKWVNVAGRYLYAETWIECAVKAFCYVAGLEK